MTPEQTDAAEMDEIVQMCATVLALSCVAGCEDWRDHRDEAERFVAEREAAAEARGAERALLDVVDWLTNVATAPALHREWLAEQLRARAAARGAEGGAGA